MILSLFFAAVLSVIPSPSRAADPAKLRCLCLAVDNSQSDWIQGDCRWEYDRTFKRWEEKCTDGHEVKGRVRVVTPFLRFLADPKNYMPAAKRACADYIAKNMPGDWDLKSIDISNCVID